MFMMKHLSFKQDSRGILLNCRTRIKTFLYQWIGYLIKSEKIK